MTRLLPAPVWAAVCSAALISCLPTSPKPQGPSDMASTVGQADLAQGEFMQGGTVSARSFFNKEVRDSIVATCGGCHKIEGGVGPGFLKSANPDQYDPYPSMVGWPDFIRLDDPTQSKFVRKGVHEGPALVGFDTNCNDQCGTVVEWLRREKDERILSVTPTFKPALKPAYPMVDGVTVNRFDLGQLNSALYQGSYLSYVATALPGGRGIEIKNLRFFNGKTGAASGEQRTIRFQRPLFVVWNNGVPLPDPTDNFAGTDRTIRLFQDDDPPNPNNLNPPPKDDPTTLGLGNLITPGIFTLTQFRAGSALSVVFDILQVLQPLPGTDPCKEPAGRAKFNSDVAPYLRAMQSCTRLGCHDSTGNAGGLNMLEGVQLPLDDAKNKLICENLKYYLKLGIIAANTNPNGGVGHPFKLTATNCAAIGVAGCSFTDFNTKLDAWKAAEQ